MSALLQANAAQLDHMRKSGARWVLCDNGTWLRVRYDEEEYREKFSEEEWKAMCRLTNSKTRRRLKVTGAVDKARRLLAGMDARDVLELMKAVGL